LFASSDSIPKHLSRPMPACYAFRDRALRRWSSDHLRLEDMGDTRLLAVFDYRGSSCSNDAFDMIFEVMLESVNGRRRIVSSRLRLHRETAALDTMCAFGQAGSRFKAEIDSCRPLEGRWLEDALEWEAEVEPAGCLCEPTYRNHKWRIVLQTIHYRLENPHDDTA
jgi:hypothetical protein